MCGRPFILAKIGKFNSQIKNGQLYFNTPKAWRELETIHNQRGQGDNHEGHLSFQTVFAVDIYDTGNVGDYVVFHPRPHHRIVSDANEKVFCMYAITNANSVKGKEFYHHVIAWNTIKDFIEPDCCEAYSILFLRDVGWFLKEIENYGNGEKPLVYGHVDYDDHNYIADFDGSSDAIRSMQCYLHKRSCFQHQHEYRFITIDDSLDVMDALTMEINPIPTDKYIELQIKPKSNIHIIFNSQKFDYHYDAEEST